MEETNQSNNQILQHKIFNLILEKWLILDLFKYKT